MATLLTHAPRPLMRLGLVTATLVLPSLLLHQSRQRPLLCDASPGATPLTSISESVKGYETDSKVPVFKKGGVNPRAVRQMSAGSILGLLGGLGVSTFSKTLALLFGMGIFAVQWLASQGMNIVPVKRLQGYVKSVDLRSAVEDNVAFKLSFGATFALASFASL